jgi:hypothetical protein
MKAAVLFVVVASLVVAPGAAAYLPFVHDAAETTLSADAFGRALAGAANQFGSSAKIVNVHCVAGDPGEYMCSYAVVRRGRTTCHLMQGRWSSKTLEIEVLLAGRTARCATLRDAIHSLQ